MPAYRIPRGYAKRHPAYQEMMEGIRPTVNKLEAALWLPIAEVEPKTDDPIVIPAGTWIGITNTVGAAAGTGSLATGAFASGASYGLNYSGNYYAIVPAASRAYSITYSALDSDTTFHAAGVVNIDNQALTGPTAFTSTVKVGIATQVTGGGVKPIGVYYKDIKASWLKTLYTNYDPEMEIGFLVKNQVVQVPCVNTNEMVIEPGDTVMVDGFDQASLTWSPRATPATSNAVGRLRRLQDFTTTAGTTAQAIAELRSISEHKVGKCLRKILIASNPSIAAGVKLSTAITAGTLSTSSQISHEFRSLGRVQTVPGLGLQGSGTLGVPGHLVNAISGTAGAFWALEILVDCN